MKLTELTGVRKGVFLSHRQSDEIAAIAVALSFLASGVPYYLDTVDPTLEKNPDQLTDHLRQALYKCTHLLAIVSKNNQGSWWVPFEIGIATERGYPIATYLLEDVRTPDYLRPWPYLRSLNDLELYVKQLQSQSQMLTESYMYKSASVRSQDAASFHEQLKHALGQ